MVPKSPAENGHSNPMTLDDIKAECREMIRLGELATEGPWEPEDLGEGWDVTRNGEGIAYDVLPDNAHFIARSRTFSPAAARAMLEEIEWLEGQACLKCDGSGHINHGGGGEGEENLEPCPEMCQGRYEIFSTRLETIRANWSR